MKASLSLWIDKSCKDPSVSRRLVPASEHSKDPAAFPCRIFHQLWRDPLDLPAPGGIGSVQRGGMRWDRPLHPPQSRVGLGLRGQLPRVPQPSGFLPLEPATSRRILRALLSFGDTHFVEWVRLSRRFFKCEFVPFLSPKSSNTGILETKSKDRKSVV